jgi:hypothetical protein
MIAMNKIMVNTNGNDIKDKSVVRIHRSTDGCFSVISDDSDVAVILTWD